MNRSLIVFIGALVTSATGVGHAQPPAPGGVGGMPRPAFSPYLNLTRPGGTPGLNYFGLVRPQQQFQQSVQNLQGAVNSNQQMIGNLQPNANGLPVTGQGSGFMNYSGYFMNSGQSRMNQRGGAGPTRGNFTNQNIRAPQSGGNLGGAGIAGAKNR